MQEGPSSKPADDQGKKPVTRAGASPGSSPRKDVPPREAFSGDSNLVWPPPKLQAFGPGHGLVFYHTDSVHSQPMLIPLGPMGSTIGCCVSLLTLVFHYVPIMGLGTLALTLHLKCEA